MAETWKAAFAVGLATLLFVVATPVAATKVRPEEMVCPVGGEKFPHMAIMSYSTFGQRPDGKPFGSLIFPVPLPECPGNGLVIFRDQFTPAEIARLADLIVSPEYKAMRNEPAYHRAAWLAERLGAPKQEQAWLRLKASWSVDGDAARKRNYQAAFVRAVDAMDSEPGSLTWWALQSRAVNAERELGDFTGATARIKHLRSQTDVKPAPSSDDDQTPSELEAGRANWIKFLDKEAEVIARRDRSSEPAEFMQKRQ